MTSQQRITLNLLDRLVKIKEMPKDNSFEGTKTLLRAMFPELNLPTTKTKNNETTNSNKKTS